MSRRREALSVLASIMVITAACASVPALASDLTFVPDPGIRVDNASNAAVGTDPTGLIYLHYLDRTDNKQKVASAADGLNFSPATSPTEYAYDSRNTLLPDGTWRRYTLDPRTFQFSSLKSDDGIHFAAEPGIRYIPQPGDNGTIGVYAAAADAHGGVVLLYLGDLFGANNLRRAYSSDNGLAFTFDRADVLGDAAAGGGPNSYVDPKTVLLSDGRRRLFTMKQGTIYSFISDADLTTFMPEPGVRVRPTDFTEFTVGAFYDPVVLRLPDGRYRMYVTAGLGASGSPDRQALVSATTTLDDQCANGGTVSSAKVRLTNFTTPGGDDTFRFSGTLALAAAPTLMPDTHGVRIAFVDAGGTALLDVTVPGGAFDAATKTGWKSSATGTSWKFSAPAVAGTVVNRVSLKIPTSSPTSVKFSVSGTAGNYASPSTSIPVTATLILDASADQCGVATFPGPRPTPSCAFNKSGSALICQ